MANYFCRITTSYKTFSVIVPRIEPFCKGLVVYEHNEDALNVHIHFLILGFTKSTDSIKGWLKKDTGISFKASDWSFKTKYKPFKEAIERNVDESCIIYMAKGKITPSYVMGIGNDTIEEYRHKWIDYKTAAKQSKLTSYIVKETAKASKLRQNEMIDEVIKRLEKQDDQTPQSILALIRQVVVVENKTILGRYKARDYYDTIRAHVNPQTWLSSMLVLVQDKNFL